MWIPLPQTVIPGKGPQQTSPVCELRTGNLNIFIAFWGVTVLFDLDCKGGGENFSQAISTCHRCVTAIHDTLYTYVSDGPHLGIFVREKPGPVFQM